MSPGRGVETSAGPPASEAVAWHDVECAAYAADLGLWRELATRVEGPVLELGAGTGRVALDLARRGHEVSAIDSDAALVRELAARARRAGVSVEAHSGDARSFTLARRFALVIGPMQVVQLLGGERGRRSMLAAVRDHSRPGALLAVALADPLEGLPAGDVLPPLPDVREIGRWLYSSRPIAVRDESGAIAIDRIREAVSPAGELRESTVTTRLDRIDPDRLVEEAREAGFRDAARRRVPATKSYVGSEVVLLEAP